MRHDNPQNCFALVAAVLTAPAPGNTCYDDLRAALLVAHQLTAFQKAEKLRAIGGPLPL